jgi:cyclopropane fatty-acyl-phospholipid synthase-like methyltransferase
MTDRLGGAAAASAPATLRDHYHQQYGAFAEDVFAAVRRDAFGEDFGQNSWHTADEQERFLGWLGLDPGARVVDIACGSGGPVLRLARRAGCSVVGVDVQAEGIAAAIAAAAREGLAERARFERHDANHPLPFPAASFDAVVCIDAINHLADRPAVVRGWARVLKPGGRLLFTDPIVVTGPLSNEEIAVRSAIGFFLFVPPGYDERVLADAALEIVAVEDRTDAGARVAEHWHAARAAQEAALRAAEGEARYEAQQAFLAVVARLFGERRLSRHAYLARKPAGSA